MLGADIVLARAGISALEGHGAEALAGYREALRAYSNLGLAFEAAAAAVDMATLLPSPEREASDVTAAMAGARDTLTRLGARPFLDRLDVASARPAAAVLSPRVSEPTATPETAKATA